MDEDGTLLPRGEIGEIVIRGANVTAGYENNPKANAEAFADGWFRTGDQGVMDADGYLSITGRLKEIINRGGEKVSPREVDEVLLDHPAVAQVVVLRRAAPASWARRSPPPWCCAKATSATERELQQFVGQARWPTSRCRGRSCSWTRSPRAPPASCSASAWRSASGWASVPTCRASSSR